MRPFVLGLAVAATFVAAAPQQSEPATKAASAVPQMSVKPAPQAKALPAPDPAALAKAKNQHKERMVKAAAAAATFVPVTRTKSLYYDEGGFVTPAAGAWKGRDLNPGPVKQKAAAAEPNPYENQEFENYPTNGAGYVYSELPSSLSAPGSQTFFPAPRPMMYPYKGDVRIPGTTSMPSLEEWASWKSIDDAAAATRIVTITNPTYHLVATVSNGVPIYKALASAAESISTAATGNYRAAVNSAATSAASEYHTLTAQKAQATEAANSAASVVSSADAVKASAEAAETSAASVLKTAESAAASADDGIFSATSQMTGVIVSAASSAEADMSVASSLSSLATAVAATESPVVVKEKTEVVEKHRVGDTEVTVEKKSAASTEGGKVQMVTVLLAAGIAGLGWFL